MYDREYRFNEDGTVVDASDTSNECPTGRSGCPLDHCCLPRVGYCRGNTNTEELDFDCSSTRQSLIEDNTVTKGTTPAENCCVDIDTMCKGNTQPINDHNCESNNLVDKVDILTIEKNIPSDVGDNIVDYLNDRCLSLIHI